MCLHFYELAPWLQWTTGNTPGEDHGLAVVHRGTADVDRGTRPNAQSEGSPCCADSARADVMEEQRAVTACAHDVMKTSVPPCRGQPDRHGCAIWTRLERFDGARLYWLAVGVAEMSAET
jgi:hypothetical protein